MDPQEQSFVPESAVTAHVMAMRAAEGAGVPQSWDDALNHLQYAAEQRLALARAELAALAGDWALAAEISSGKPHEADWRSLRRRISIADWLQSPPKRIVSASPRIAAVEGFASRETCQWLIGRARDGLSRATVFDHETGQARTETVRTNSQCYFKRDDGDLILAFLRARISRVIELPVDWMEVPMVLHYAPGEEFLPHVDFLDTEHPGHAIDLAERGQRVLTFLLVLNEGYEGGETEFTELHSRWKGRAGSALFFWNVEPDGRPDLRTAHAGLPPANGEKWLLSQWVRVPASVMPR
ncbi:MAG TPA: 2OG-Fe(II) oxygenase [Micropepsaceae bacterium]|nr:2OG-Fe(II) oxygenase [Micropepsaceae bacterium]